MRVHAGEDLLITRLVVYNPAGCIIETASNLLIHASFSCDVDNALETKVGADFWWHKESATATFLESQNAAAFHLWKSFDETTFTDVSTAAYVNRRVERLSLTDQVLFAKTNGGRFAKLHVWAGDSLAVKRLTVFNANGTVHLDKSNLAVPGNGTIDLDTGQTNATGADLRWLSEGGGHSFLVPMGGALLSYASYYRDEKYFPLLRSTAIRNALVYQDAQGTRGHDAWPEGDQDMLREFLQLRELDREPPISGPPALINGQFISACDAKKIYLAHVSQSLWIEANAKVPWKVAGAGAVILEHLFDMRRLLLFTPGKGHSFDQLVMGSVTQWSPSIAFDFLDDQSMIKSDAWKTIQALAEWVRANLVHVTSFASDPDGGPFPTQADQWQHIYGYRWLPLVDKMLFPLPGRKHTTQGCWGTSGFLAAMLRTINIPVRHGRSNFSGTGHSRAEFFTVSRNFAHSDDPYNQWVLPGHNNVPIHRIFLDNAQLEALIDAPPPDAASLNHRKLLANLAVEFKTDTLLRERCFDISHGLTGHDMHVWKDLHEFHSDAEINTIVAQCNAAIAAIPGGCAAI